MADITLYGADISPFGQRVQLQLEYKQLEFTVAAPPGGLKSAAFRTINPLGKIPVLQHGALVLPESEAICEYLEERFPDPSLLPPNPAERARGRLIVRICDLYLMIPMMPLFANLSRKARDQAAVDAGLAAIANGLDALDRWIAPGRYANTGKLTLADFAAAPILRYLAQYPPILGMKQPFDGRPNVSAYYEACREDPHVDRGLARIETAWAELRGR